MIHSFFLNVRGKHCKKLNNIDWFVNSEININWN